MLFYGTRFSCITCKVVLLNIKDKNIKFGEDFCREEVFNSIKSKVFYGTLTYIPKACYHCGHVFDKNIIKHGFK